MLRYLILFGAVLSSGPIYPTSLAEEVADPATEALIEQLQNVHEPGYGYTSLSSGSVFLPLAGTEQVHVFNLAAPAPKRSPLLQQIVERGAAAVPVLLRHLDDARPTRLAPVKGLMWIAFDDEYDFNRRIRDTAPEGVNRHSFEEEHPASHRITVGDLCYVALGQIVNRRFNATRYQPTGGVVISSTSHSEVLCRVVRQEYEGYTAETHRRQLIQDFLQADIEDRRIGAYQRLAFFYPEEVEGLVLEQLRVPAYDVFLIEDFVTALYRAEDVTERRRIFDNYIATHGQQYADGILLKLFDDLDLQEAAEQGRLHPRPPKDHDARAILIALYGYGAQVQSAERPFVDTWSESERARFIMALVHDDSKAIDAVVARILDQIADDDYLALSCMERLLTRGYQQQIMAYCKRRIGKDEYSTQELEKMLERIAPNAAKR